MDSAGARFDFMSALDSGQLSTLIGKAQEYVTRSASTSLQIAVMGKRSSGKSSFISAAWDIDVEGSVAVELTTPGTHGALRKYKHPKQENVFISELPAIEAGGKGGSGFRSSAYLTTIQSEQYDVFVMVSAGRFSAKQRALARALQHMGKECYFVRSQVDGDLGKAKRWQKCCYREGKTLDRIRNSCLDSLRKGGMENPEVFLISSRTPHRFDFGRLLEALARGRLPGLKGRALLFSLSNVATPWVIDRKKEVMLSETWKVALLSAAVSAVPVPGLSVACNAVSLVGALSSYRRAFGLDKESLRRWAKRVGKTPEQLQSVVSSTFGLEVSDVTVVKALATSWSLR
eukprot:g22546.t1